MFSNVQNPVNTKELENVKYYLKKENKNQTA